MTTLSHTPRSAATAAGATLTGLPTLEATDVDTPLDTDPRVLARAAMKSKHSQGLARLLEERGDLRGVHALADFVHDSVRWTA